MAGPAINSIATFSLWSSTLVVNTMMPVMIKDLKATGTFFLFAACSFIGACVNLIFMRDTKGLGKEELRVLFFPDELKSKSMHFVIDDEQDKSLIDLDAKNVNNTFSDTMPIRQLNGTENYSSVGGDKPYA